MSNALIVVVLAICALCVVADNGADAVWKDYEGSIEEVSGVFDIDVPTDGQAAVYVSSVTHIHQLSLIINGGDPISIDSAVKSETGGTYISSIAAQECDLAGATTAQLRITCMDLSGKSSFEQCTEAVAMNYTVHSAAFNQNLGDLVLDENVAIGFPYASNTGLEHDLYWEFTTPKVSSDDVLTVTVTPMYVFPDQTIIVSSGNDATLLSLSESTADKCPYSHDDCSSCVSVAGTDSMTVSTANMDNGIKSNNKYSVYFQGAVKGTIYVMTVSVTSGVSRSGSGGGGGVSGGWVTVIAFLCFFVGVAVPILGFAGYKFYLSRKEYEDI